MAWYSPSWLNREKITVAHGQVGSGGVSSFPVYVNLADLPAGFFSAVQSTGADIRVTQSDGTTECAIEVVAISTSGKTGELHFQANSLSSSTDTVFYIYFNNPSATAYAANATYGAQHVWDSNYKVVYHLEANGNDSTANGYNLTDHNTPTYAAGKIGKAINFVAASSQYSDYSNPTALEVTGDKTIEHWVNFASSPYTVGAVTSYGLYGGGGNHFSQWDNVGGNYSRHKIAGLTDVGALLSNSINTWYSYVYRLSGTTHSIIENNSASNQTVSGTETALTTSSVLALGRPGNYNGQYLDGAVDEFRISIIARSDAWLTTTYNNQNSSSTFYSVGAIENNGAGNFFPWFMPS